MDYVTLFCPPPKQLCIFVALSRLVPVRKYLCKMNKYLAGDYPILFCATFQTTPAFHALASSVTWRNDSAWARGLSWALYGFGTAYTFTNDARFLQTAEACAEYYIQRTPEHGIPPNDWDEPGPVLPYESSAAAIAAGGMWNLSRLTGDPAHAHPYRAYSLRILDTLTSPEFLAIETPGWEGILKHGIYHQRKGLGVDESVIWGDYFLLDALNKVIRERRNIR
jgi:unsaturated chondroitin disaccharide hydrolase